MKRALLISIGLAASMHVITTGAGQLASGRNVNLHPGIADQYVGDIYLQRKVEPKVVCSSTNTLHCVAIANDYRLTDPTADVQSGFGETAKLYDKSRQQPSRLAAGSDAWLGLYRTSNQENFLNGMVPGFPGDNTPLGLQQPWAGLATATDGGLATDGEHFYGVGLFFNRGSHGVVGAFRLTDYNDESKWPIRWDAGYSRNLDMNNSVTTTGQFADLPSIVVDPFRQGSPGGAGKSECKSHVYVGYTMFAGGPTNNSFIKFVRSLDCGATYSKPITLQGTFKSNQRVVLAVDPRPGTPKTTGGGTVYAVWRSFTPDQIVMAKTIDFGETWSKPIAITALSGPANLCTYDQPTVGRLDTSNPADETARALSFASAQVDGNGKLYVVWTERVDASGNALATASCTKTAQPKIVITSSNTGGKIFTTRRAVDMGPRCEAGAGTATGPRDVPPSQGGNCPAGASRRLSGPQIQPSLSHNAGKLVVLYSEGRGGLNTTVPLSSPSYGYFTGRDARMDVRAAQIDPTSLGLISTTQLSQYTILASGQIKDRDGAPAGSKAVSLFFLPQYKGGTVPFKGDHDDITAGETFIWESPARWATAADVPSARFFAIFGGDTRESRFPGGDLFATSGWSDYKGVSSSCDAGIRLSNNYFAYVGSDLEAVVHQSFKPLNGLQRTWAVTLRNRSLAMKSVTLSLVKKPDVTFASFDQTVEISSIGTPSSVIDEPRLILPHSSFTFTVFGRGGSANAVAEIAAPIKVLVDDLSTLPTTDAIVRLNPNPVNPAPLAGGGIATSEHHGPSVLGPFVKTYDNWNPTPGNPTPGNPTPGNPTPGNPTPGNPTPGNVTAVPTPGNPTAGATGFSDYTDYRYVVAAQDANTLSAYSTFGDIPLDVDDSHIVQMFITRVATTPTLKEDCSGLAERQDGQLISIINANSVADLGIPTPGNPTPGNPTPGNPTPGNPTLLTPTPGNPTPGNPTPGNTTLGNNTFALSPASTPQTAGLPSTYKMTAIASAVRTAVSDLAADLASDGTAVASPGVDYAIVTFRFYHCESNACGDKRPENQETVPRSCTADPDGSCANNDPASNLIGFVTIPEAGNNNNGTITPPQPVSTGRPVIMTTTLPDAVAGSPYSQTLSAVGGVTPYTWSVVDGNLPPGLSLNAISGEISGTPMACLTWTYPFTARVTDSGGQFDTQNLSIKVNVAAANCAIAVWADGAATAGGNGIVQFINATPGFTATLVTTLNLETAGFLNNFHAIYVTRANDGFGTGLTPTAAANVSAFVSGGPVVLFVNDWNDNLPQSAVGDPADANTSQLIQNAIMLAGSEHGYVGEFNGAEMAFTSNANGFQSLNLMAGSAGATASVSCSAVTITAAGSVIRGTVATNFTPADQTCFSSLVTGVAVGNVWATYDTLGGRPAVVGRRALPPIIIE